MTNLSRIKKMPKAELIDLFAEIHQAPGFEYIDFDAWLSSSSPEWTYKGYPGVFTEHVGKERECVVVGSRTVFSRPYKTIIVDGQIMQVPKDQVRAAGKESS